MVLLAAMAPRGFWDKLQQHQQYHDTMQHSSPGILLKQVDAPWVVIQCTLTPLVACCNGLVMCLLSCALLLLL
jgi:hypothetical protein